MFACENPVWRVVSIEGDCDSHSQGGITQEGRSKNTLDDMRTTDNNWMVLSVHDVCAGAGGWLLE